MLAHEVNTWLDKGCKVVSVTAQHLGGNNPNYGTFAFILERPL